MVHTFAHGPSPALAAALSERPVVVVGLCAAWCDTCGAFRPTFDRLAAGRVDATFVWLDIEDDAAIVGDVDVDNFPTLAVFANGRAVHFGASLPQQAIVDRLLASLDAKSHALDDPSLTALAERLRAAAGATAYSPSSAETN